MTPTRYYGRTALPKDVHAPMLPVALLWMAVIFSPFVAFTVNGRVDDSNWMPAFVTAGVSLLILAVLHIRARSNYRQLPAAVQAEYYKGKLYPALRRTPSHADREFELGKKDARLGVAKDGMRVTTAAWLRADYERSREHVRKVWAAGNDANAVHVSVPWRDIREWEVHDDSDGPDYYRLRLADDGYLNLRRPSKPEDEYELLDLVRSTGQVGVRVFCDVPRP